MLLESEGEGMASAGEADFVNLMPERGLNQSLVVCRGRQRAKEGAPLSPNYATSSPAAGSRGSVQHSKDSENFVSRKLRTEHLKKLVCHPSSQLGLFPSPCSRQIERAERTSLSCSPPVFHLSLL